MSSRKGPGVRVILGIFLCGLVRWAPGSYGFVTRRNFIVFHQPSMIDHGVRYDPSRTTFLSVLSSSESPILQEEEEYEEYSRCLSPREERRQVLEEGIEYEGKRRSIKTLFANAIKPSWFSKVGTRRNRSRTGPGTLILMRCGESDFNANQTFSGWLDPDLTERGIAECEHAARLLLAEGFEPTVVYTSRLKRSIKSAMAVLRVLDSLFLPVFKTYRLNQRMYGALQGLSKVDTAKEIGDDAIQAWRNSLRARPPALSKSDPHHPIHDRRYRDLSPDVLPSTETLLDCQERGRSLWDYKISDDIKNGETVLVVGHRDSIRGLIKVIDGLADQDSKITVPGGIPIVYKFRDVGGKNGIQPIEVTSKDYSRVSNTTSGFFLGAKSDILLQGLQRQEKWSSVRFLDTDNGEQHKRRSTTLQTSLSKLRVEQELVAESGVSSVDGKVKQGSGVQRERWVDDPCEFEEYEYDEFSVDDDDDDDDVVPTVVSLPDETDGLKGGQRKTLSDDPVVVLIRHGRTPHNNLGLFTGWEDPPLADEGIEDAIEAGRLLRRHGMEFDVVYTSWLTRAIQTAYYVMDELDCLWLPMVKSWRLNERMYGALTGKSKKRVANDYGEEQLKRWRRGYTVRPPPTSSYSLSYPGNDLRRSQHFKDLPISWKETIFRSLDERKPMLHRRFPKTESLKDCMDRSIPFYTQRIREEAVEKGKRVLITSHENAIRGILMHLCDIPEDAMNQLHLPNGLPLVYNVKRKCITLLDDGTGRDPMDVHDFGPAAQYLFKACELPEDFVTN